MQTGFIHSYEVFALAGHPKFRKLKDLASGEMLLLNLYPELHAVSQHVRRVICLPAGYLKV